MVSVKFSELVDAFEFTSFGGLYEAKAFVNLDTGALLCISDDMQLEDQARQDLDASDRYLALPHKNDLGLGRDLALSFIEQHLPGELDRVSGYFHKRGAYSRFKDLLEDRGAVEAWYAFEKQATEDALRQWCDEHGIECE